MREEALDQKRDPNRIAQRRLYITPTVKIVAPLQVEQSNQILRKFKYAVEYFTRINIISDNKSDMFFNNKSSKPML